ncbi:MAG: Maf-like protein [Novosphingobium sp.]|nr:Maf-like protein [Novosphingobium sp.]
MLVLASKSASRRSMLEAAAVPFQVRAADVDESAIRRELIGVPPAEVATVLAEAKAMAVSIAAPGRLVLGSDSLVEVCGRLFGKPKSRADAAEHLRMFSGREMRLWSAAVLVRDGHPLWRHVECAKLTVRSLSDEFIAAYLDAEWPDVAGCVGVFRIEGRGVQLFERIDGSHFTVLGMPLLPLLSALREHGELVA